MTGLCRSLPGLKVLFFFVSVGLTIGVSSRKRRPSEWMRNNRHRVLSFSFACSTSGTNSFFSMCLLYFDCKGLSSKHLIAPRLRSKSGSQFLSTLFFHILCSISIILLEIHEGETRLWTFMPLFSLLQLGQGKKKDNVCLRLGTNVSFDWVLMEESGLRRVGGIKFQSSRF